MIGPFGGYGGNATTEKGRVSYDIPASVDGKPAGDMKIIARHASSRITLDVHTQATPTSWSLRASVITQKRP